MKIVCQACGAKYSIADEKVAGKTFKIRCKKCSEVIVVRGDQQNEADGGAAESNASSSSTGSVWHVVVSGEQQGPFAPAQIGEMLATGVIDWEAYVWREGFDNWLAARDVEELVSAVMGTDGGDASQDANYGSDAADVAEVDPSGSVDINVGAEPAYAESSSQTAEPVFAAAAPEPEAAIASRAARRESVDLFAQAEQSSSLFGASSKEMPAPAGAAPAGGAALTGLRNENSVLFSLSSLQANASSGGAGAAPASPGAAKGGVTEGSGLIDIRALSATVGPAASKPSAPGGRVDDLLSLGAGNSAFGSALAAPTLTPIKQESGGNKGMMIGAVVAVVLAAGGAAAFFATRGPAETPAPAVAAAPAAPAAPAPAPAPAAAPAAPAPAAPAVAEAAPAAPAAAPAEAAPTKRESEARRGSTPERTTTASASAPAASAPARSEPARTTASSSTRSTAATGGNGNLDDLLNRALGSSPAPQRAAAPATAAPAAAPSENLPETPAQAEVRSAIAAVQPAVSACSDGTHGLATTTIEFTGATGRVRNANVTGQFQGTPVGSCIARAVRAARVSRFSREVFSVSYPFRI